MNLRTSLPVLVSLIPAIWLAAVPAPAQEGDEPAPVVRAVSEDRTVTEDLVVQAGEILRIEAGVTLRFAPGVGISAEGAVEAVGTAEKPVVFTAADPESGWGHVFLKGPGALDSRFAFCRFSLGRGRSYRFDKRLQLEGPAAAPDQGIGCGGALFLYAVRSATLEDCVFEKNRAGWGGGAVACWAGSCPRILRCRFGGNAAGEDGGALHCVLGACPTVSGCAMTGNTAQYGGAVHCLHMSHPVLFRNDIRDNDGSKSAGAVSCFNECCPALIENRITGNHAEEYGAMNAARSSRPTLFGNLVAGNESRTGKGMLPPNVLPLSASSAGEIAHALETAGVPAVEQAREEGERED